MKHPLVFSVLIVALSVLALTHWCRAEIATEEEARLVADSWIRFIVQRDGSWGGAKDPYVENFEELQDQDIRLGYVAKVNPLGYILISPLKNFAPIYAYSTKNTFDLKNEYGMPALFRNKMERRMNFLRDRFGRIDEIESAELEELTPETNRLVWRYLVQGTTELKRELASINTQSVGNKGPLLETSWHQLPPYNDDCPDKGCSWPDSGSFNRNVPVGCVPLALAQVMKYWSWPPQYDGYLFDWPSMQNRYDWDDNVSVFRNEKGAIVTQRMIDAVAELCLHAGKVLYLSEQSCNGTSAALCHSLVDDARDALEDHFYYSNPNYDHPKCEYRSNIDNLIVKTWFDKIATQINLNRPLLYRVATGAMFVSDYDHAIVIDGYDDTSGMHQVHANYGHDGSDTAWYTLEDYFYCGLNNTCNFMEEEMIRSIYPRNAIGNSLAESYMAPVGLPYRYFDQSATGLRTTFWEGQYLQFLPNTTVTCTGATGGYVRFMGTSFYPILLFSHGDRSKGIRIKNTIKLHPNGGIKFF